jgi:hypothetical protein
VTTANVLIAVAIFAFAPLLQLAWFRTLRPAGWQFYFQWACTDLGGSVSALVSSEWLHLAAWGSSGLLALVLWWWSRRKGRRKTLRLLGGKARAVLAAMAGNMPKPGSALRPVPQGV